MSSPSALSAEKIAVKRTPTHLIIPAVVAWLLVSAVAAAKDGPYQPMGAPADPKVDVSWNRYHDYAETTRLLKSLVAAHPDRAKLASLGKSHEGREMWVLTVTSFKSGDEREKPAFWIDGGLHANEVQGTQVAMYTAWYLLEMYDRNPFIQQLVDQRTFYLAPMTSPDSRDAHMYKPNTTHSPRSGQRPVDDDRDGLTDEDGPDDLNHDGHITQMRVRDPNGRYKPHADHPRLMVRVARDEWGEYRLLGSEGFDNDGDGRINEDGDGYYDPNRDWPRMWKPKHIQRGAFRYPFSVLENRMVGDFIMDHPNIAGAQSYHNTGGMILRGPGNADDHYDAADLAVYDAIAAKGELMLPGYDYLECATDLYSVYGGEFDWLFGMRGIFSYSNELFTRFNYFREVPENGQETTEDFNRYLLFEQGAVAWTEVDHPQYGKVEVGGMKKNWGRQPPSFLLEEECHRNMAFTLYHADQMPRVEIHSVDVRETTDGLFEVTAVVRNVKLTPTRAALDVRRHITPPDVIRIEGANVKVVVGLQDDDPFFPNAVEQKRSPNAMRIDAIGGMRAVYVRWLVKGKGPFTVSATSIKGGADRQRGEL